MEWQVVMVVGDSLKEASEGKAIRNYKTDSINYYCKFSEIWNMFAKKMEDVLLMLQDGISVRLAVFGSACK